MAINQRNAYALLAENLEVIHVAIQGDKEGRLYTYLWHGEEPIEIGDTVVVPVGSNGGMYRVAIVAGKQLAVDAIMPSDEIEYKFAVDRVHFGNWHIADAKKEEFTLLLAREHQRHMRDQLRNTLLGNLLADERGTVEALLNLSISKPNEQE